MYAFICIGVCNSQETTWVTTGKKESIWKQCGRWTMPSACCSHHFPLCEL